MELLELFAKAIAPKVLERVFDNIPQSAILFAIMMFFVIKYLLKWNKARVEKIKAKEERSNQIWKENPGIAPPGWRARRQWLGFGDRLVGNQYHYLYRLGPY